LLQGKACNEADVRKAPFIREAVVEWKGRLVHWIDALADWLEERLRKRNKQFYVFNGGLSVSGLQHIGRLRGEIIIPETIRRILEQRGFKVKQYLTLYTQDAWKGKESQLKAFPNPEQAKRYTGWPLIRVPDPKGELSNWVERFWRDFGPYIGEFTDGKIEVVTTTELYKGRLMEFVRITFERRKEVRDVINKYRGRKPYPENWIPFEPICGRCGRIDTTEALEVDMERERVRYRCKNCGYEGWAGFDEGKLNWRIEWVGVWWALGVDFEPYGKDHATPGGSRDSANELALTVYGIQPPEGLPYEWVALRTEAGEFDMSSSDFIGITPREWLEVAHPEILRFLVLKTPPMRKLTVSMKDIPLYYDQYYRAERVYFKVESTGSEKEDILLARSYELSYAKGGPPEVLPAQPPYTHVAILSQVLPRENWLDEGIRRLQKSGHLPEKPSSFDIERVKGLFSKARTWVERYAPDHLRVKILEKVDDRICSNIPEWARKALHDIASALENIESWDENSIKNVLVNATRGWEPVKRKEFYRYFYMLFVGRESGPRAAPFLALLDRRFVVDRLRSC
jgi:lysyl-tRNA synthetase class 1